MPSDSTDVLVAGAGPTGLFLALLLARLGVRVRVVDRTEAPGTTSRALAVQARTLEFYQQVDLADEVVRRGLVLGAVNLWRRGEHAARIELGDIGRGLSPYPFGIIFPQDEHERLLIERLQALGVVVERRTAVESIDARPELVVAQLRMPDGGTRACEAAFVAGCDGARSTIREAIGAGFPGGTYEHSFYVADVEARGRPMDRELHVLLDDAGFLGLFPLAGERRARLIGTIRDDASGGGQPATWEDVDRRPIDRIGLMVDRVNWFSTYRVHHRVAEHFRRDRVFLLGDAAHIHSPVGGQGMNTGLGDAMNLAWKLAAVIGARARADLLETYEPERIAFARRLVATTDRAFKAASSDTRVAEVLRTRVVPRLIGRVSQTSFGRRLFFRALSQIGIEYRKSTWSTGRAGTIHGGDRLPWVEPARAGETDNFAPLCSLDWQVHVYGDAAAEDLRHRCENRRIPVHLFSLNEAARRAGLRDDAVYLVRPDGYVGAALDRQTASSGLEGYFDAHLVRGR